MGAWGLLPFTAPLLAFVAWRLGALAFPQGERPERAAAAVVLGLAFVQFSVGGLGQVGLLTTPALILVLLAGTLAVLLPRALRRRPSPGLRPTLPERDGPREARSQLRTLRAETLSPLSSPGDETLPQPSTRRAETLPEPSTPRAETLPQPSTSRAETLSPLSTPRGETLPQPSTSRAETLSPLSSPRGETLPQPSTSRAETLPQPSTPRAETLPQLGTLTAGLRETLSQLRTPRAAAALLAIFAVLVVATATARLLPLWQWDSLGYHLPFVNFVLQSHGFAQVPRDVRYISTYPHNVELAMVWLRAMLPDDRLVDFAQVPYGAAGALLTAALARRLKASRELALLAAAGWLCAPAVFLQLPTNYVDVGTAVALLGALFFLVFSPPTARALVVGGVALGLFLGSKPSAPPVAALLLGVAAVRALRAGQLKALGAGALATAVFGGEMYALMLLRHGNPVWPVALKLGPLTLPGESSVDTLLAAGAASQRAGGGLLARLLTSWVSVGGQQVFDMRVGGLGALFLLALPLALWAVWREKRLLVPLALLASLLSPDPAVARYVLAFPALVLALAAAQVSAFSARAQVRATALVLGLCAAQVAYAWHGLVGDGPPWSSFLGMSDEERRVALGPSGPPVDYPPLWDTVQPGESAAFDTSFEFPAFLWSPTRSYRVDMVPRGSDPVTFWAWVEQRNVRVLAVGPEHRALVESRGDVWEKRFDCSSADCAVYARR